MVVETHGPLREGYTVGFPNVSGKVTGKKSQVCDDRSVGKSTRGEGLTPGGGGGGAIIESGEIVRSMVGEGK